MSDAFRTSYELSSNICGFILEQFPKIYPSCLKWTFNSVDLGLVRWCFIEMLSGEVGF